MPLHPFTATIAPMDAHDLERQATRRLSTLIHELTGEYEAAQIERLWEHHITRLAQNAKILDYIPLLASRFTKEDLRNAVATHVGVDEAA